MDTNALAVMASATIFSSFVVLIGWRWNFVPASRPASHPAQD